MALLQESQLRLLLADRDAGKLDLLLEVRDEDSGQQMSDAQVIDEVITIFIAGHETTAVTLTWAWLLLADADGWRQAVACAAGPAG